MKWEVDENFLCKVKVAESRKKRIRKSVRRFLKFLNDHQIKTITEKDINTFLYHYSKNKITEFHAQDLKHFFDQLDTQTLYNTIDRLQYKYTAPFKLKQFKSVIPKNIRQLESLGIFTNYQLLYYLQDNGLKRLLTDTGIKRDDLIRIIRLSDITRLFAVKETLAELYLDSGFDSVKAIAGTNPTDLIGKMSDYVNKMELSNLVPKPKEATFVINYANKVVEFSDIDINSLLI